MLTLENVGFNADGKDILKGINVQIPSGITAITGPNGGGKSTLAKLIMGIEDATEGKILFNGTDLTHMPLSDRAKFGVSYAFQQPVRFKGLRVRDLLNLAYGKDSKRCDVCDVLCQVGLCSRDYIDRELNSTLSGGEIKRIEVAMSLARNANLSIFDEPEAGIDRWSFENLIGVFTHMAKGEDKCIVIITHQERILDIADNILYLKQGHIESFGPRDEILPTLNVSSTGPCGMQLSEKEEQI